MVKPGLSPYLHPLVTPEPAEEKISRMQAETLLRRTKKTHSNFEGSSDDLSRAYDGKLGELLVCKYFGQGIPANNWDGGTDLEIRGKKVQVKTIQAFHNTMWIYPKWSHVKRQALPFTADILVLAVRVNAGIQIVGWIYKTAARKLAEHLPWAEDGQNWKGVQHKYLSPMFEMLRQCDTCGDKIAPFSSDPDRKIWTCSKHRGKMEKLKVLDLFSGIGGFSLGLERTGGFETVDFCRDRKISA